MSKPYGRDQGGEGSPWSHIYRSIPRPQRCFFNRRKKSPLTKLVLLLPQFFDPGDRLPRGRMLSVSCQYDSVGIPVRKYIRFCGTLCKPLVVFLLFEPETYPNRNLVLYLIELDLELLIAKADPIKTGVQTVQYISHALYAPVDS
ncbi:unnamed protein product [Nezara viridula]|uniref:Uncharacterized protein n=1 Tax=Nezara viridula TaxID=85310 RepID=A0A9P0MSL5_NEZVI|nr:unnamed protein product [Nezara viridula]